MTLDEFDAKKDSVSDYLATLQEGTTFFNKVFNQKQQRAYEAINEVFEEYEVEAVTKPFDEGDDVNVFRNTYKLEVKEGDLYPLLETLKA